jgi:hypothetical protein
MQRLYRYVGPEHVRVRSAGQPCGTEIRRANDVVWWAESTSNPLRVGDQLPVTFVVLPDERLLVADRHSEHIACAGGSDVLAAGELFLSRDEGGVFAAGASNQSTGYCPEPDCWPAVERSLDRAGIAHPGEFTVRCVFRRCTSCQATNVVKDGWFVCSLCAASLPADWNFDTP